MKKLIETYRVAWPALPSFGGELGVPATDSYSNGPLVTAQDLAERSVL